MASAKIMIVEDNTTVAEDCSDCLVSLGYDVISIVASGEEAVAVAEAERPDAVVMDVHLRDEMDGIDAAELIYSRFKIPVVFLSAYSDRELLDRVKLVGSFGYMIKPFKERELAAMLEMALYRVKVDRERRQMEERLQQAYEVESVGTLAGGIAHQFNNALCVVTGNIDLLEMNSPGDENVIGCAKEIKDSVSRMTQLTSQLLAYAGGGKYQVTTLSLSDFIRDSLPLLRPAIGPAIEIVSDLPRDILDVLADPAQLQMVLSAVLINASEALEGKGHIRVACGNMKITNETSKDFPGLIAGDYVSLAITDDGKGMDEETRKRIFEPFFTSKFQGRGLGMAAVYGIVKNHDGWIAIDSEPGRGTTVKIYLPAARPQVRKPEKPKNERIEKGTGTILVVEDEEMVIAVYRSILEELGYRVLAVKTGRQALDLIKAYDGDIDLVLLDIVLPDINGSLLYPLLMEARPDLKVIVCSGYSIDGPAQDILDAGAQEFIQKPFTIVELSRKLKNVIKGK
ncbi:MAG: response regulator [Deltaproteobacteria bacterium]|nr:response regulator [Candidatus Tharpella aukensis]